MQRYLMLIFSYLGHTVEPGILPMPKTNAYIYDIILVVKDLLSLGFIQFKWMQGQLTSRDHFGSFIFKIHFLLLLCFETV